MLDVNYLISKLTPFRTILHEKGGATAVVVAITGGVLAGLWALSFDLGRAWNLQTELQNAADAAAIACATQLDTQVGAQTRAIAAASTGGLVQNQQTFASDGLGADVTISGANVVFLSSINPDVTATGDADSNFCQVTVTPRTVNFSFSALVSAVNSANPVASALAERGKTAKCKIPPLVVCNPDYPAPFDIVGPPSKIGWGITLKSSNGPGLNKGNFGLLAVPTNNAWLLSASKIRDAWGRVRPLTQCFGDQVQTKPGQTTSIAMGLNMRFDVYPTGTHQVPSGEPPVKNNPNYTPSKNAVKALSKSGASCALGNPQGWNDPPNKYNGSLPADMMGYPRDGCAYGGACDVDAGGGHWGDGNWSRTDYMTSNHASPDFSMVDDLNGNGKIERYEVYKWEKTTPALSNNPMEDAAPICSTAAWEPELDRRVVTAAVVDCVNLGGTTIIKPDAWIDLFLTEPMGAFNGNNDLYGEIIGVSGNGAANGTRHIVRLVR
jgi:Flp pilus assembly protein TadG